MSKFNNSIAMSRLKYGKIRFIAFTSTPYTHAFLPWKKIQEKKVPAVILAKYVDTIIAYGALISKGDLIPDKIYKDLEMISKEYHKYLWLNE